MKNIDRRKFIIKSTLVGMSAMILPSCGSGSGPLPEDPEIPEEPEIPDPETGEMLYNGIQLPKTWPPADMKISSYEPMPVPYLTSPPATIPIDVGRQLFVDDFLIGNTTLKRKFYKARKIANNPVLKAESSIEEGGSLIPGASAKDGGVWWDSRDKKFKMWYEAGWLNATAYAESTDGIQWDRPNLNIYGLTNRILPDIVPNSSTVFIDFDAPDAERFKMFLRPPNDKAVNDEAFCLTSADGIYWDKQVKSGVCGDRSTMFYNPFRKKWVFSIRSLGKLGTSPYGRARYYREHSGFLQGAAWSVTDPVFWTNADYLDEPDPAIGDRAELYNLAAVGYESIMLGLHQIHLGPVNDVCKANGVPKTTDLKISFSRNGFHWDRPFREAFIPSGRTAGIWDRGYVQSVGGICTIVGDQLRFYYIGFKGDESRKGSSYGMHSHGATGMAVLRRDGFASMYSDNTEGYLTTRVVTFTGKYLFVNVNCPNGKLSVEILDENNTVIAPFSSGNCQAVSVDSTIQQIKWSNSERLSSLIGKKVRFKFQLTNGELFAFWVSPDINGASHGFIAAGGPGYSGGTDTEGISAYNEAASFTKL